MPGGQLSARGRLQDKRLTGLKGEDRNTRSGAGLQGLRTKARDVKAQVVVFSSYFYRHRLTFFARQFSTSNQAFICAFKPLDREHGTVFDQNRLADLEPGNFFGNAKAKLNIGALALSQFWSQMKPARWHQRLEPPKWVD